MRTPEPAHQRRSNQVAGEKQRRRPSAGIARQLQSFVGLVARCARVMGYVLILHPLSLIVWLLIALVILWAVWSMTATDYRSSGLSILCTGALAVTLLTLILYLAFISRCLIASTLRAWHGDVGGDAPGFGDSHTQQDLRVAVVGQDGVVAEVANTLASAGYSVSVFPARTVWGGTLYYKDTDQMRSTHRLDPNQQPPAHIRILTHRVFSEQLSLSDLLQLGRFDALVVRCNGAAGRSTPRKTGP